MKTDKAIPLAEELASAVGPARTKIKVSTLKKEVIPNASEIAQSCADSKHPSFQPSFLYGAIKVLAEEANLPFKLEAIHQRGYRSARTDFDWHRSPNVSTFFKCAAAEAPSFINRESIAAATLILLAFGMSVKLHDKYPEFVDRNTGNLHHLFSEDKAREAHTPSNDR